MKNHYNLFTYQRTKQLYYSAQINKQTKAVKGLEN